MKWHKFSHNTSFYPRSDTPSLHKQLWNVVSYYEIAAASEVLTHTHTHLLVYAVHTHPHTPPSFHYVQSFCTATTYSAFLAIYSTIASFPNFSPILWTESWNESDGMKGVAKIIYIAITGNCTEFHIYEPNLDHFHLRVIQNKRLDSSWLGY